MIKVLHILTDSNIGGAGIYLENYLKHFDQARFSMTVVLPTGSLLLPKIQALNIPVVEAEEIAEKSFSLSSIQILRYIIRREQPQIVHTHGSLSGRIAAKQCGVKIVYTRHCAFPVPTYLQKGPGHWLNGVINGYLADQIIAVSPAAAKNLTDSGVSEKKITAMMNGCQSLKKSTPEQCAALREKLNIPDGTFTMGIMARLEPYKGHMQLLEAAKALKAQCREFRILICGSGSKEENLRSAIARMNLGAQVSMLGFVPNVSEILSILDVQVNCSYGTETSSIALIEGMTLGVATVASDYGGNPWLVENGINGLLYETMNSRDLEEKLAQLMDHPDLLQNIRHNARRVYEEKFTGEIFARNIEAVYEKAIDKK